MRAFCLALLTLLVVTPPRAETQMLGERQVKAAFLYNFAKFTEWPSDAFPSESSAFVIGIAGDEFMRVTLDSVLQGKVAGTRPLTTRRIQDIADTGGIQILYIGSAAAARGEDLVKAVHLSPVLTVGDIHRFLDIGGMISFLSGDNRVRFEIQPDAIDQSRLKMSSRVLTLAKLRKGTSKP